MKSIKGWSDWYIHPFTLIYLLIAYLNDFFVAYISALIIVCIHEFGHYYFARLFNFDIDKVEILPFGAFLSLNDYGTHHIVAELIVIMAGLATHLIMGIVIELVFDNQYLLAINRLVFMFNLLPLYPLDGSKILLLLLSLIKDYYQAITIQIKISIFTLSLLIILYHQIGHLFIYIYLLSINYQYIKEFRYQIIRLYLKRMKENNYRRIKLNYSYRFYRPYVNYYLINGIYFQEKEVLQYLIKNLKSN